MLGEGGFGGGGDIEDDRSVWVGRCRLVGRFRGVLALAGWGGGVRFWSVGRCGGRGCWIVESWVGGALVEGWDWFFGGDWFGWWGGWVVGSVFFLLLCWGGRWGGLFGRAWLGRRVVLGGWVVLWRGVWVWGLWLACVWLRSMGGGEGVLEFVMVRRGDLVLRLGF